ncbi:MAG: polymer-forming cytoskeletal protein [Bryobacteraceae bacterium]
MQMLHGKIEGPLSIEEDSTVHGMITAGATVRAFIHGTVNGTVWNRGNVVLYATIDDAVDVAPECSTVIDARALIRKRQPMSGERVRLNEPRSLAGCACAI